MASEREVVKASFNLPKSELDSLREIADRSNISVTQALRQAIAHEGFMLEQIDNGNKVLIEDSDHNLREVVLDPTTQASRSNRR